jgi:hypothetical protein
MSFAGATYNKVNEDRRHILPEPIDECYGDRSSGVGE